MVALRDAVRMKSRDVLRSGLCAIAFLGLGITVGCGDSAGATGRRITYDGGGGTGACIPNTCAEQDAECGFVPDGCGGKTFCGYPCPKDYCGGNGPNRCGNMICERASCQSLGAQCGSLSDGCSDILECGECKIGTCKANHCDTGVGGSGGQAGASGQAGSGGQAGSAGLLLLTPVSFSLKGNGVLEPGETVVFSPVWKNKGSTTSNVLGSLSAFQCPSGAACSQPDSLAVYGSFGEGESKGCTDDCYQLALSAPTRPAEHWDATIVETLGDTATTTWSFHLGNTFMDVPSTAPYYRAVEILVHNSFTTGCGDSNFCPDQPLVRSQAAVFVARALAGSDSAIPTSGSAPKVSSSPYQCESGGTSLFTDVSPEDVFCKHVHYLASKEIAVGCGSHPPKFCVEDNTLRQQLAVFLARSLQGGDSNVPLSYTDPLTHLSYDCSPGSTALQFSDVSASQVFCKHVYFLWARGIAAGATTTTFKPEDPALRQHAAVFVTRGFGLTALGITP